MPSPNQTALAKRCLFFLLSSALLLTIACSGQQGGGAGTGGQVSLQGAGATFPNPLYQKWLSEYGKLNPDEKLL